MNEEKGPLDRPTATEYASWFKALADPTRIQIVSLLARVSDIIADPDLDPDERAAAEQHIGCAASTLTAEEYRRDLHAAGFTGITITPTADTGDGLHAAIVQAAKPAG